MELTLKIDDTDFELLDAYCVNEGGLVGSLENHVIASARFVFEKQAAEIYAAGLADFKAKSLEEQRQTVVKSNAVIAICDTLAKIANREESSHG